MSVRQSRRLVVLSFILAFALSSVPLAAAPRDRDSGKDLPILTKIIKRIKLVVIALGDTMSPPIP
jgi:hypothetical protein